MSLKNFFSNWIAKPVYLSPGDRETLRKASVILGNIVERPTVSAYFSNGLWDAKSWIDGLLEESK